MKKFEFKQRQPQYLHLDIAGNKFNIPFTLEFIERYANWGKKTKELAVTLPKTEEGVAEACMFLSHSLDEILGEGATAQIFKDRALSIEDLADIMNYISDEITEEGNKLKAKPIKMKQPEPEPVAPEQASVETAMKILQNPEVMQAITKAMQK